jgi:hypothetical protein
MEMQERARFVKLAKDGRYTAAMKAAITIPIPMTASPDPTGLVSTETTGGAESHAVSARELRRSRKRRMFFMGIHGVDGWG